MKAQVYTVPDGIRLGLTSLRRQVEPALEREGFHVGTYHGEPVIRSASYPSDVTSIRNRWAALTYFVGNTGYHLKVELNAAEAEALMRAGFINTSGAIQRIVIADGSNGTAGRVAILAGHGSVR